MNSGTEQETKMRWGEETSITCDPRNVCARERDRGRERGHRGMNRVGEDTLNPI